VTVAHADRVRALLLSLVVIGACATPPMTPSTAPATPSGTSALVPTPATATPSPLGSPGAAAPTAMASLPRQLLAVQLLDQNVGWIATASGLFRTADAGRGWISLSAPPFARFAQLRFIDATRGWAVLFVGRDQPQIGCMQASTAAACRNVVATTDDGGATWRERLSIPLSPAGPETIRGLQAIDMERAWVIAQNAPCDGSGCPFEVRGTTDGGRTWRAHRAATGGSLRFASASRGWLAIPKAPPANGSVVLVTSDGGTSWKVSLETTTDVQSVDAASETEAWALARDGAFCTSSNCIRYELFHSSDGGASWESFGNVKEQATCSGGHLGAPLFASPRIGWMPLNLGAGGANVGPGGLMRTTDGGRTWDCRTTPANAGRLSAADPLNVWATSLGRGAVDGLYATSDGGASWMEVALTGVR
jgi:photosystem II stability/assembly factor-like uncharacterized protein